MSQTPFPIGASVLLHKSGDGWLICAVYPPGTSVAASAIPAQPTYKKTLAEAVEFFRDHHLDDDVPGGHPPSADPTSSDVEPSPRGTVIWVQRQRNGWNPVNKYPGGGISQRMSTYRTFADVAEGQRLLSSER